MRVRYLTVDIYDISEGVLHNRTGEIAILPDEKARILIADQIVEPFSYNSPDKEIKQLYNKFNNTGKFEEKVDILVKVLSREAPELFLEADPSFMLEDGTTLIFAVTPESPSNWYYYNNNFSELYTKKYKVFIIEDLKNEFDKSLINYPYVEKRKEAELEFMEELILSN